VRIGGVRMQLARARPGRAASEEQQQLARRVAADLMFGFGGSDEFELQEVARSLADDVADPQFSIGPRMTGSDVGSVIQLVAAALERGELTVEAAEPAVASLSRIIVPMEAPPEPKEAPPRFVPPEEPARGPEPAMPGANVDQDAQALTLLNAALQGAPFLEECPKTQPAEASSG